MHNTGPESGHANAFASDIPFFLFFVCLLTYKQTWIYKKPNPIVLMIFLGFLELSGLLIGSLFLWLNWYAANIIKDLNKQIDKKSKTGFELCNLRSRRDVIKILRWVETFLCIGQDFDYHQHTRVFFFIIIKRKIFNSCSCSSSGRKCFQQ